MIASLTGKILFKFPEKLILDVHGVGYEVFYSEACYRKLPEIGQEIFLYIHTHVREDALTLFGFHDTDEKETFLLLLTVSGIGPKLALAVLSGIRPGEFAQAIIAEDITRLTRLSGVGKKKAERLCLELKDKVQFIMPTGETTTSAAPDVDAAARQLVADVVSALVNLGYPQADAGRAVEMVYREMDETAPTLEKLLRLSLRSLV
jgi:Holliday junction DNA helicase RuvA